MSFSFVIHSLGTVQTSRIFYHSKMLHFTTKKAFRDVVSLLPTFILAKQTVFIYVEVRSLLQMSWGAIHKNTCNSTFMLKKPGPICYQIKFVIPFIWVEKYIRKNYPCFFLKQSKNIANQMNLKDAFWNWVVTYLLKIQNLDMHLACLEMRVARMNFDLILLPTWVTSYVVWMRLPLPRYIDRKRKFAWIWMKTRPGSLGQLIGSWFAVAFPILGKNRFFFVTLPGLTAGI